MKHRFGAAGFAILLALGACSGGHSSSPLPVTTKAKIIKHINLPKHPVKSGRKRLDASGQIVDGGFESGAFGSWQTCGNGASTIESTVVHSGSYAALTGNVDTTTPEESGLDGVCQEFTVPASGQVTVWVNEGTSETSTATADQEGDIMDVNGNVLGTIFSENANTSGWQQRTYDLSSYAGQDVWLFFGIYGSGSSTDFNFIYVDDVSVTGSSATPTPAPTAAPTPGATPTPGSTPTPGAFPCNNQQFLSDQQALMNGTQSGYIEEDVCGTVTQVLPEKTTTSGPHGYYYVQVDTAGDTIEIVSNLNEMNAPAWPWVNVGDYSYVQGRQYYDSNGTAGIDWTHHGTSSSWGTAGYVVINGTQYQ